MKQISSDFITRNQLLTRWNKRLGSLMFKYGYKINLLNANIPIQEIAKWHP